MPDRDYVINFDTRNASRVVGEINSITAALLKMDSAADKAQKSLLEVGKATAAMSRTDTKARKLASDLDAVAVSAGKAGVELKGVGGHLGALPGRTDSAASSLVKLGAGFSAMGAAKQVMGALVQDMEAAKARLDEMTEKAAKFRDSLRETANVKGAPGATNRVMSQVLEVGVEAGMLPEDAKRFVNRFDNAAPTARERDAFGPAGSPQAAATEKELLVQVGRMARRRGIDEGVMGEAFGGAAMFGGFDSVEKGMEQMGGAMEGLSKGKLEFNAGVPALGKAVAKLMDAEESKAEGAAPSRVTSYARAGVYMGAMSLGTGTADQASHRMIQSSRILNTTDPEARAKLAELGVTDAMDDPDKMIALSKAMKAKGFGGRESLQWLADNKIGGGQGAGREALVAGMGVADVMETRLADLARGGLGKAELAANDVFTRADRTAHRQTADSARESLEIAQGEGYEEFENAKKFAAVRMQSIHGANYKGRSFQMDNWLNSAVAMATRGVWQGENEEEDHIRMGAIPILRAQAKKAGFDLDAEFPVLNETASSYHDRATAFGKAAGRVRAANVDPFAQADYAPAVSRRIGELGSSDAGGAGGNVNVQVNDQGLKQGAEALKEGAEALHKAVDRMGGRPGGGPAGGGQAGAASAGRAVTAKRGMGG